jgi:protein-L-isoaspartate(D-aspartate) O-methyltransferase
LGRFDFERAEMIDLLRQRGITDEKVLKAMEKVERHLFVGEHFVNRAYDDTALPIDCQQTISQPYTVAFMTENLQVQKGDRVLEVGTGSGYQAALLGEMGAHVFTIERHFELLHKARKLFDTLGYNIASKVGDGTVGWSEFAPFDRIIVTAGAPDIPPPLLKQLADDGRLVIPVGSMEIQVLKVVTKQKDKFITEEKFGFKFVPLVGKEGWR